MDNQIYDDEKQRTNEKFDSLMQHNLKPGEEDQMEAAAKDGGKGTSQADARAAKNQRASKLRRQNADRTSRPIGGSTLNDQENAAAGSEGARGRLASGDLKDAESKAGGLFNEGDEGSPTFFSRVKNISARRKALGVIGIGGTMGLIVAILTVFPIFRMPSIMSGVVEGIAGHAVKEVLENRADRLVMGYVIHKAGVDAVAGNGLRSTLWKTFRAKNVEGKILKETGFEWRRVGDEVRMFYYDENDRVLDKDRRLAEGKPLDLGSVKTYDDVIRLTENNPVARAKFKKVLRISSGRKVFGIFMSSEIAQKALKNRFPTLRFAHPEDDKSKTKAENLADLHVGEFDAVDREQRSMFQRALACILQDQCDFFKKKGSTGGAPNENVPKQDELDDFAKNTEESSTETRAEVKKVTEKLGTKAVTTELPKIVEKRLLVKIVAIAGGPIELLSWAATIYHFSYVAQENNLIQAIPSTAVAYVTGAQAAFYAGQAGNIMAGKTPLYMVADMNKQIQGAEKSAAYKFMYTGNPGNGVPVDTRVDNDVTKPMTAITNTVFTAQYYTLGLPLVIWYYLENFVGDIIGFFTGPLFNIALEAIFGPNYEEELNKWLMHLVLPFFAGHVDAFATGAKWMNQIFVGWTANINWYCEVYLGCRTTSALKETFKPNIPGILGMAPGGTQEARDEMASLSLTDRLFSLQEPYSLFNEVVRATPTSLNPGPLVGSIFSQIGSLPSSLFAALSPTARAEPSVTPQQIADLTGVRQYGYLPDDLKPDTAQQVIDQAEPVCPEDIDQEKQVNLCMADREVAKAMLCQYADCPEYSHGFLDEPDTYAGIWANVQQLWKDRQGLQALIW